MEVEGIIEVVGILLLAFALLFLCVCYMLDIL